MKQRLQSIVDNPDTRAGRIFESFIHAVILISIASFTIETIPGLDPSTVQLLNAIEFASVAIFTVELLLRLLFSRKGFRYLFTFFGLIDVLAIAPFYLALGVDLRGARAFRLLRLFRLFKFARYSRAAERYRFAFQSAREELLLFGATALIVIFLAGVGIHYFESAAQPDKFASIPQCLWWAVATLTTVGYGDVYPITAGGKLFTFAILAVGLAAVAVPTGILASALSKAPEPPSEGEANPESRDGARKA